MIRRLFTKLTALFVLLLIFETAVMEVILWHMMEHTAGDLLHRLAREALWSGLLALLVALPVSAWVAARVSSRLQRVIAFSRRVAQGDLSARLVESGNDELAAIESALNQTAQRLGENFAEIESRRHELATMLDSMQEAVVAVTSEGQVRWSNAVMQRIAGTEIRAGRPLIHFVRDPDLLNCIRGALDKGEVSSVRASSLAPGRVFEISAAPLPSGGALAVLHDVTRIEAAERSRREFVANVSHELRTPLTSIQGYVETLLEDPKPGAETTQEFLQIVLKNATRMNRLTEDLLALATVESPDYRLAARPMRARDIVRDAIESLRGMLVDSDVELESADGPDELVMADPDAMNQVFGNLVENAVKYGKTGKRVIVGARLVDSEVEFFVQDFGPGMASEHLDRIFERFYRVDKGRSREAGGTGLGLAIVKHIVLAHGGRIRAESELGSGTRFLFALPIVQEKKREDQQDPSPATARERI